MMEPGPTVELDLFHPAGFAERHLALGGAVRPIDRTDTDGPADVVVIAPLPDEAGDAWLLATLATAAGRMAEGAIAVVSVPPRARRAAEHAIGAAGLELADAFVANPPWPDSQHFVPIRRGVLADGARRSMGVGAVQARVAGIAARFALGRRRLRRRAEGCVLIAQRASGPALFAWLGDVDGRSISTATVSGSNRADARTTMVLRYPSNATQPDLAVKVALDAAGRVRLESERVALSAFGANASRAGAEIPRPAPADLPFVMATRMLPGDVAADMLDGHASRLEGVARPLVAWLTGWNQLTATNRVATPEDLHRFVLDAADRVTANDAGLTEYRRQIGELARRVYGQTLVLVAAHNDLTLANVLVSERRIGVVDWEGAEADVLPMTDLWYALSDAVARARGITHAAAVEALVLGDPAIPQSVRTAPTRLADSLAVPVDERVLCFHACWLHHAANELERGDQNGRFLAVVRTIAAKRLLWPETASSGSPT